MPFPSHNYPKYKTPFYQYKNGLITHCGARDIRPFQGRNIIVFVGRPTNKLLYF